MSKITIAYSMSEIIIHLDPPTGLDRCVENEILKTEDVNAKMPDADIVNKLIQTFQDNSKEWFYCNQCCYSCSREYVINYIRREIYNKDI